MSCWSGGPACGGGRRTASETRRESPPLLVSVLHLPSALGTAFVAHRPAELVVRPRLLSQVSCCVSWPWSGSQADRGSPACAPPAAVKWLLTGVHSGSRVSTGAQPERAKAHTRPCPRRSTDGCCPGGAGRGGGTSSKKSPFSVRQPLHTSRLAVRPARCRADRVAEARRARRTVGAVPGLTASLVPAAVARSAAGAPPKHSRCRSCETARICTPCGCGPAGLPRSSGQV